MLVMFVSFVCYAQQSQTTFIQQINSLQILSFHVFQKVSYFLFLPCNKYHFSAPEEQNLGPVIVIQEGNDQNEGNQVDESRDVAEPMENSAGLTDAIETPELETKVESLKGKSNSLSL